MANMSYCRMQNTRIDLQDVYENWDDADSEEEISARAKILKLCKRIVDAYDDDEEEILKS